MCLRNTSESEEMHLVEIQQKGYRDYPFIMFGFVKYWDFNFLYAKGSVVAFYCRLVLKTVVRYQFIN